MGTVATNCKVIGHSRMRCAKTAEPIDMSFWIKPTVDTRVRVRVRGVRY